MFRIKICGITNVDDALAAMNAGADAIGLNFYPRSNRSIDLPIAKSISESVPDSVKKVGVFVNASGDEIASVAEQLALDIIQLHGDEPPALLSQLPRRISIIRAFRCGSKGLQPLQSYLKECESSGRMPDAVLIDSDAQNEFGGTGHVADWTRIANERDFIGRIPLLLGGGLTPANLAEAIAQVKPDGVDVASGVESAPGRKDIALVQKFVTSARSAFAALR